MAEASSWENSCLLAALSPELFLKGAQVGPQVPGNPTFSSLSQAPKSISCEAQPWVVSPEPSFFLLREAWGTWQGPAVPPDVVGARWALSSCSLLSSTSPTFPGFLPRIPPQALTALRSPPLLVSLRPCATWTLMGLLGAVTFEQSSQVHLHCGVVAREH